MKTLNLVIAGALAWLLAVPVAEASTLPPLELAKGESAWSAGLVTLAYDHGVGDRWALGATASFGYYAVAGHVLGAVRGTYRLLEGPQGSLGLGLSAGYFQFGTIGGGQMGPFVQPIVVATLGRRGGWRLSLSAGPSVVYETSTGNVGAVPPPGVRVYPLIPNAEVAIPVGRHGEVTLGGLGLVGWRGYF